MLRFLLGVLSVAVLVPVCLGVLLDTIQARRHLPEDPLWVLAGVLIGISVMFLRRPNWFLHTLVHECGHLLACALLGVRVHRLLASDGQGGEVSHAATGPLRSTLIALAPYTLPLILGPLLVARGLTPESWLRAVLSATCAAAYPLHLTGLIHNVRINLRTPAGDLAKAGRLLSLAVILSAALLVSAGTIIVLWDPSWHWPHVLRLGAW